jgi:hypothetical protein
LAQKFNLCFPSAPASWRIRFLPCWLYSVWDFRYSSDPVEFLVEEELEGQYTKWWVGEQYTIKRGTSS